MKFEYRHVDVFSPRPYSGNSLPVFPDARGLSAEQMLCITKELRHFEAIFLERQTDSSGVCARVFDLCQELPFAGHPVIGAAAVCTRNRSKTASAPGTSISRAGVWQWSRDGPTRGTSAFSNRALPSILGRLRTPPGWQPHLAFNSRTCAATCPWRLSAQDFATS